MRHVIVLGISFPRNTSYHGRAARQGLQGIKNKSNPQQVGSQMERSLATSLPSCQSTSPSSCDHAKTGLTKSSENHMSMGSWMVRPWRIERYSTRSVSAEPLAHGLASILCLDTRFPKCGTDSNNGQSMFSALTSLSKSGRS